MNELTTANSFLSRLIASPRRLIRVGFSDALLAELVRADWHAEHLRVMESGVPRDAKLVGLFTEDRAVWIVFEHESFMQVREGEPIPVRMPVYRTEACPADVVVNFA